METQSSTEAFEPLAYRYRDAARLLGISERSLRRLIDARELPTASVGKSRKVVLRQDLLDYLESVRS